WTEAINPKFRGSRSSRIAGPGGSIRSSGPAAATRWPSLPSSREAQTRGPPAPITNNGRYHGVSIGGRGGERVAVALLCPVTVTELSSYASLFFLVALESMGVPLPGETALVTAAAVAATGRLSIP